MKYIDKMILVNEFGFLKIFLYQERKDRKDT